MSRYLLVLLSCACGPKHEGVGGVERVALETIPLRSFSVAQAQAELWRPELRPPWRAPTAEETSAVGELIPELLRAARAHVVAVDVVTRASTIGMRVERWDVAGSEHLALLEVADQRRGAGAYLFSVEHPVQTAPWILWQAPHPYFDLRTGEIAAALYFNPPTGPAPAAFFTSSMHRYTQADGKRDKRSSNPADPCHDDAHLFNVATQAAARTFSGATVVQLHGFANSDEEGGKIPDTARAIVSAGRKDGPTPLTSAVASGLGSVVGTGVLLYPTDVQALGATTNVQMKGLTALPDARFVHVEMAAPLRDLLVQDPSVRDAFGARIFAAASSSP